MSKDVSTGTFSELAAETEAELLSDDSVETPDTGVGPDELDDGQPETDSKPGVLDALNDSQSDESETVMFELPDGRSVSKEELISGNMKDADYRQKTADLAEQRRKLEAASTLWEALQDNPIETVKRLARDIQQGKTFEPAPASNDADGQDIDSIVAAKVEEALGADRELVKEAKRERAVQAVNKEFNRIETAEGVSLTDGDRRLIIEKAQSLGTTDLEFVFKGLLREIEKVNAAKSNAKSTSTAGKSGANAPDKSTNPKDINFRDLFNDTLKEQGLTFANI